MTALIELDRLSFRYPGADRDTLRNVSLTIEEGDFVAVIGGNGSGKTTLCKTFNGLVPHYWAGDFAGEARVAGLDTYESSVAELSGIVGYVYQDFQNQLVRPRVRDEVEFGPMNFGMEDFQARGAEAMAMLGIDHLAERFVWQLSGGQAHLTALASVLSMRPRIIVVDEPVAEVDPAGAHALYERLTQLNRDHGITVVVIEHHAEFISQYAKSVILMDDGAPVWHLPVAEAAARADELATHGIPAPQIVDACAALDVPGAPRTVAEAATLLRDAGAVPRLASSLRTDDAAAPHAPGRPVVTASSLSHGYRTVAGDLMPVLHDVDLAIHAGDRVALVGGNGAGKSTLMRLLGGLQVPRGGSIVLDGVDTRSRSSARLADHAAYLFQRPEQMFLKDSVRADVRLHPAGRGRPDADALVDRVLDRVRLTDLADRDGRTLSGGQQRRATLAIGLAMSPALLLADEPTASLDVASRDSVIAMLDELSGTIAAAVVATHDMHLVAEWATRVIVLEHGRIVADLPPRDLFADDALLAQARLVPPQIVALGRELGLDPVPLSVAGWRDAVAPTRTEAHA
ncbi:ATP-binding cassette domain-containing protein [Demequina sp. SYSU T00192]|uniref:ATP-binding cassette domain-containing protein n=1 Tax=Demequina litoralis TaxID=3051660 RepID=A0ABT8G6F3_9MICO|nr:ABC transporter ATP-binding protein [Demequina sp. SYSU T00192]MDN4474707.1 ATP-binding cassette domain-containing protein [Demequina sp. SYSU T00192]